MPMPRPTEDARYAVCFSGGKDSMLALDRAVRNGLHIAQLVTLYDEASNRIRFHGVPIAVMRALAHAVQLPMGLYPTTPTSFESVFRTALQDLHADGIRGVIFGNIHLADVRAWYEDRVHAAALEHVEPLWGEAPSDLVREVLARGYTAIVTGIEEAKAEPEWLGRALSEDLLAAFTARGSDPCGERGEYHTLVTNGPLFHAPVAISWSAVRVDDDPQLGGRFRHLDVHLCE